MARLHCPGSSRNTYFHLETCFDHEISNPFSKLSFQIAWATIYINLSWRCGCLCLEEAKRMSWVSCSNFTIEQPGFGTGWRLKMTNVSSFNQWNSAIWNFWISDLINDSMHYPLKSITCTTRQVHLIYLLTRFDIDQMAHIFLVW